VDDTNKDALRERNRRRAHACAKCGSMSARELPEAEIARRDDTFPGLRYRECMGCGNLWSSKPLKR
jgi:hypothetical protein